MLAMLRRTIAICRLFTVASIFFTDTDLRRVLQTSDVTDRLSSPGTSNASVFHSPRAQKRKKQQYWEQDEITEHGSYVDHHQHHHQFFPSCDLLLFIVVCGEIRYHNNRCQPHNQFIRINIIRLQISCLSNNRREGR